MELDDVIYKWIINAVRHGKITVDEHGDVHIPCIDVKSDPLLAGQLTVEFFELFAKSVVDTYGPKDWKDRDKRVKEAVSALLHIEHLSNPSKKDDQYALDHMYDSIGHELPDELFSDERLWEGLEYRGTAELAPLARQALELDISRGRILHTTFDSAVRRLEREFKKRYRILVARGLFAYALESQAIRIMLDVEKLLKANGITIGQPR